MKKVFHVNELKGYQKKFREAILEELKSTLQFYTDYINIRIQFFKDRQFHIHIIEDGCAHLHLRGELNTDSSITINRVTVNGASQDALFETFDFVRNY